MKFADRHAVEGTFPVVYIGRRVYGRDDAAKVSRRYYAEWCLGGRADHQSLGTTNKQAAIRKAHDICRQIADGGDARPRARKCTVDALIEEYLQLKRDEGLAPKSLSKYENDLRHFQDWAAEAGVTSAVSFGVGEYRRFGRVQREAGYGEKTVYARMVLVKQAFKWAWDTKLLPEYALRAAKLSEPAAAEQPCFTPQQVATLVAAADPHEAAIYATLAYAGLRIGEARELRWSDVLWDAGAHGFLVIRRGGSGGGAGGRTKNRKVRRLPIHAMLRPYLERLPRVGERVFTARATKAHPACDRRISERRLLVSLKRLCTRVGFQRPRQYKLHTFRHAFASMCARNNVSYKYALAWMGHSSSEILDLYYSMFDEVADMAMATIDYPVAAAIAAAAAAAPASHETGERTEAA